MKTQIKSIENLIEYTNLELVRWYENVKSEYGVIGFGETKYNESNNTITVDYTEEGTQNTWSMAFYPEYLKEQKISWVFNCWMELA